MQFSRPRGLRPRISKVPAALFGLLAATSLWASNSPRRSHPSLPIRSSRFRKPRSRNRRRPSRNRPSRRRPERLTPDRPPTDTIESDQLPGRAQGASGHAARDDLHQARRSLRRRIAAPRPGHPMEQRPLRQYRMDPGGGPNRLDHHLHRHGAAGGAHHQVRRVEIDHHVRSAGPVQGTPRRD